LALGAWFTLEIVDQWHNVKVDKRRRRRAVEIRFGAPAPRPRTAADIDRHLNQQQAVAVRLDRRRGRNVRPLAAGVR
jgi:hypothetical protein